MKLKTQNGMLLLMAGLVAICVLVGFSPVYYGYLNTLQHPKDKGEEGIFKAAITLGQLAYPLLLVAISVGMIKVGLSLFTLDESGELEETTDEGIEETTTMETKAWKCQYCGAINTNGEEQCNHCGAPRKGRI